MASICVSFSVLLRDVGGVRCVLVLLAKTDMSFVNVSKFFNLEE